MINGNSLRYPDDEISLKQKIDALNDEWYKFLCEHCTDDIASLYVSDGFYPYYTHQKIRILFIGKEALEIAGCDYMETLFEAIKLNRIGEKTLNQNQLHRLLLYITYGLQRDLHNFENIPYATEISKDFATQHGISYAFMNLSKFSNESGEWQSDEELIDMFLKTSSMSNENLFAKEIEILNPHLIIGMNLNENERMDRYKYLGKLKSQKFYGSERQVCAQRLETLVGEYNFLDCYHFSAIKKSDKNDFYLPIVEAVKNIFHTS